MEWKHDPNHKVRALVAYKENGNVYWNIKDYDFKTQNVFFGINEYYVREYVKKYGQTLEEFEEDIINIGSSKYFGGFRAIFGEVLVYRTEPYEHCCIRRVDWFYGFGLPRMKKPKRIEYIKKDNGNRYGCMTGAEKVLPLTNEFAFDIMYFANFGESLLHKRNN